MTALSLQPLTDFESAWRQPSTPERLHQIRDAALVLRQRLMQQAPVLFYKSIDLYRDLYPIRHAYSGVYTGAVLTFPYVHLLKRVWLIQFNDLDGCLKTLLFSPGDEHEPVQARLFQRFDASLPRYLRRFSKAAIAPNYRSLETAIAEAGVLPEQIDYISYGHLHGQHLSRWLGTSGFFPNARLLVHQQEWADQIRHVPALADDISMDRVIPFAGSVLLGNGLALVHSPGLTAGHHALVARVPGGVCVTSANGVGADAYAPRQSRIKAIRRYAEEHDLDVIVKGKRRTSLDEQYISMVMEKTLAGPSHNPDFPNCAPSSEATPYWLMPAFAVSFLMGELQFGSLQWPELAE